MFTEIYPPYLHEVTEAFLTEDIFEEDQVLFMVGIRVELRGEQGQSLMQPYESSKKPKKTHVLIIHSNIHFLS